MYNNLHVATMFNWLQIFYCFRRQNEIGKTDKLVLNNNFGKYVQHKSSTQSI